MRERISWPDIVCAVGTSAGIATAADISVIAPVNTTADVNVDLGCWHDQTPQSPYLEAIALEAIRLGDVQARGN